MVKNLGTATLEVGVEGHADSKFNSKLVFYDLEPLLGQKGYLIQSSESRGTPQKRRDTPMAVRALTSSGAQMSRQKINVKLRIIEHEDTHSNAKIVFEGLEEALALEGIIVRSVETREAGQGTPIAARVKIVMSAFPRRQ